MLQQGGPLGRVSDWKHTEESGSRAMPLGLALGSCVLMVLAMLAARGTDQELMVLGGAAYSHQGKGFGMEMVRVVRRAGQRGIQVQGGIGRELVGKGAPGLATIAE